MFKNVASQKIAFYVHDVTNNVPKTGDAANITAYVSKDGGAASARADTSATELDATNAKGVYFFDVAQSESNGDILVFSAKSSTSGIQIDPLIVFTVPANFTTFSIDSNGRVDLAKIAGTSQTARDIGASVLLAAASVQAIWDALTSALTTTGSIGKLLIDKLSGVSGQVASQAEVTSIQNNTRATISVPEVIERPDSGSVTYRVELCLYDDVGNMEAPDSAPTIALVNQSGTDRSSRLDSATMTLVTTGRYRVIYTADVADTLEQLNWTFSIVEGGATRVLTRQSVIVDTTAVDFTASDRSNLNAVKAKTDSLSFTVANQVDANVTNWKGATAPAMTGDAFARLGAPAGASVSADIAALPTANANADALLKRDWTTITGEAARSVLNALRFLRNKWSISGTTLTVTKEDDATAAWTATVSTDAAADPITGNDPS